MVQVGPQKSEIELDFDSAESARYVAEITSLPAAPMPIAFAGDEQTRSAIEEALKQRGVHVSLVSAREAARYALTASEGRLALTALRRDVEIGFANAAGNTHPRAAAALAPALKHVLQWERTPQAAEPADGDGQVESGARSLSSGWTEAVNGRTTAARRRSPTPERTDSGARSRAASRVRNRTEQTLFTVLAYFSELYGIYILPIDPIPPGDNWVTVWGDGPDDRFLLEDDVDESTERFKLLVATEKVDDFLLMQPPLTMRDEYGATRGLESIPPSRKVVHTNEWFAKDFQIRIVRG